MTTITLVEATEQAKRACNRAMAKTLNCVGMYGYRKCTECRLYLTCQLQSNLRQKQLNYDQLILKTNENTTD